MTPSVVSPFPRARSRRATLAPAVPPIALPTRQGSPALAPSLPPRRAVAQPWVLALPALHDPFPALPALPSAPGATPPYTPGDLVHDALWRVQSVRRHVSANLLCSVLEVEDALLRALWLHGWLAHQADQTDAQGALPTPGHAHTRRQQRLARQRRHTLPPWSVALGRDARQGDSPAIEPQGKVLATGWTAGHSGGYALVGQVRYSLSALRAVLVTPAVAIPLAVALYGVGVRLAAAATADAGHQAARIVAQEVQGRVHFVAQPPGPGLDFINGCCPDDPERALMAARHQALAAAQQAREWATQGARMLALFPHAGQWASNERTRR